MASRSDGSAIKALLPISKGDLPAKKNSPSSKNDPPPLHSIKSLSPQENTPLPNQNTNLTSSHKNTPPPSQNVNSPTDQNMKSPPKEVNSPTSLDQKKKKMYLRTSGKPHLNYRSTSMTYSSRQRPYPAKCRSMVLCSLWRKSDKTKRKERCLSLSWTNNYVRL